MHGLPARLLERRKRYKVPLRYEAGFFRELSFGRSEPVFARIELALGNGPCPCIFCGPERTARVDEKDFEDAISLAVKQESGA
jgi:hypothetical protein